MLTPEEYGRIGGLTAAARHTAEERRAYNMRARLTVAVNAVVNRAPELNPEQIHRLHEALSPVFRATPPRGSDVQ